MRLPAFSAKSVCPKCGAKKVGVRYEGPIENDPLWYTRTYEPPNKWPKQEYMHRTCSRCKYEWPKAVAKRAALSAGGQQEGEE